MSHLHPEGLLVMPLLVFNLGGEMVYIIRRRLQAQNVEAERSQRVLDDIMRCLCGTEQFVQEIFTPQRLPTYEEARASFDRLAHCSIMKLNKNSMDKLFDLMVMAFKFQVMSCKLPIDLVTVTAAHMASMLAYAGSPEVADVLKKCSFRINETFGKMTLSGLSSLRQHLCLFFQDRDVKVSIFLQESVQDSFGKFVIPSGGELPASSEQPGTLRRFFNGGAECVSTSLLVTNRDRWTTEEMGNFLSANAVPPCNGASIYDSEDEDAVAVFLDVDFDECGQMRISCSTLGGDELANYSMSEDDDLAELRANLATELDMNAVQIRLVLPDGRCVQQFNAPLAWALRFEPDDALSEHRANSKIRSVSVTRWLQKVGGSKEALDSSEEDHKQLTGSGPLSPMSALRPSVTSMAVRASRACVVS